MVFIIVSNFVERSEATVDDVDGGAEADGGSGVGSGEGVFDGVERFDAEFADAVGDGFGEKFALAGELGCEGGAFLEPVVDGGAVDLGFAGGAGDGAAGEEPGDDLAGLRRSCGWGCSRIMSWMWRGMAWLSGLSGRYCLGRVRGIEKLRSLTAGAPG
jgi:hypothetical protein